jgi:hypothetical protein
MVLQSGSTPLQLRAFAEWVPRLVLVRGWMMVIVLMWSVVLPGPSSWGASV